MQRYQHDMKVAANKRYIIFGMVGCLCFGIGDWLLGYVEPTLTGGDVFYTREHFHLPNFSRYIPASAEVSGK